MKVMLLAAGMAKRLHPLTLHTPKQLLPLTPQGDTLLSYHLKRIEANGFKEVVLNVSGFAKAFHTYLETHPTHLQITIIEEGERPIGTHAGIQQALPFLGDAPFLLLSSDTYTHAPLSRLHQLTPTYAHLCLMPSKDAADFSLQSHQLSTLSPDGLYAGMAVCHPRLWDDTLDACFGFGDLIRHHLHQGHPIEGSYLDEFCMNINRIEDYERLKKHLLHLDIA